MDKQKENRRAVVVTGASSGIGKAVALALDADGFRVFAGVREKAAATALEREASGRLVPLYLDVTDEESIARAVETVSAATGGRVYGLVNNAGVGLSGPLEIVPIGETRALMEVNVIGVLATTKAFLPLLRNAGGRIVNMGSLAGLIAMPGASSYAASKFALQAITDSLRVELAPFGVRVAIVDPGAIASALWEKGRAKKRALLGAAPRELLDLYAPLIELGQKLADNPPEILPASRVAEQVAHALSAKKPKVRYLVGPGAKKAAKLARMPVRLRDWMLARFLRSGAREETPEPTSAYE